MLERLAQCGIRRPKTTLPALVVGALSLLYLALHVAQGRSDLTDLLAVAGIFKAVGLLNAEDGGA